MAYRAYNAYRIGTYVASSSITGSNCAAHWTLLCTLIVALTIDVMKPASLGFTIPGMIREYHVSAAEASLVPFFALVGTVVGSVVWGVLADLYGRKASILLAAVVFVGTAICGAMPS